MLFYILVLFFPIVAVFLNDLQHLSIEWVRMRLHGVQSRVKCVYLQKSVQQTSKNEANNKTKCAEERAKCTAENRAINKVRKKTKFVKIHIAYVCHLPLYISAILHCECYTFGSVTYRFLFQAKIKMCDASVCIPIQQFFPPVVCACDHDEDGFSDNSLMRLRNVGINQQILIFAT